MTGRLPRTALGFALVLLFALIGGQAARAAPTAPTAQTARNASPPAHILQVRWTAAVLWYQSGTNAGNNFSGEGNNKYYAVGGHVGIDVVWREKVFPQQHGPPLEYPFTPTLLYASARVQNTTDVAGVTCQGTFNPYYTTISGTNHKIPQISGGAAPGFNYFFPTPPFMLAWLPTAPAGTICARPPETDDGWGCNTAPAANPTCVTHFSPVLPVPPYLKSDNDPEQRGSGARLIVDWRQPNVEKAYRWDQTGSWSIPEPTGAMTGNVHMVWFACASVQEDPPGGLPRAMDPFTMGGYRAGSVLSNPNAPPPNSCSSKPTCVGPIQILKDGIPVKSSMQAVIGEAIHLTARCVHGHQVPPQPRWTVAGATPNLATTSVLSDLKINDGGVSAQPVTNFSSPALDLYFRRAGRFKVKVASGGGHYTTTFDVSAPQLGSGPYATTCRVGLYTGPPIQGQRSPWVGLGWNNSCPFAAPLGAGAPGIMWHFPIRAPTPLEAGKVGLVQVITTSATHDGAACPNLTESNQADVHAFYDQAGNPGRAFVTLSPGTTAHWRDRDSPHLALRAGPTPFSYTIWTRTFAAEDYLMYKPSRPGSIWLPLGHMSWGWFGAGALSGGNPLLVTARSPVTHPAFVRSDQLPDFAGSYSTPSAPGC